MPPRYAARTEVPESKSRTEIEQTLTRFGATAFAYGWSADHARAQVMFEMAGRRMRFEIPLPDRSAREFTHDRANRRRTEAGMRAAYDQELRRLWRSLALVIKAKLEAVATGIVSMEVVAVQVGPTNGLPPADFWVNQYNGPSVVKTYAPLQISDFVKVVPGTTRVQLREITAGVTVDATLSWGIDG